MDRFVDALLYGGGGGGGREPVIEPLTITENGTYPVPEEADGFGPVVVNVPQPEPVIEALSVTENGTYPTPSGVDGFNPVTVNVPPSGAVLSSLSVKKNRYNTYFPGELFNSSETVLTAHYSNGAIRDISTGFTYSPSVALTEDDAFITFSFTEDGVSASCTFPITVISGASDFDEILDNNSWLAVQAASERQVGANYWAVGDVHRVTLDGVMNDNADIEFDGYETNVFIIGFDHNMSIEGRGISFQGFKQYDAEHDVWLDICLSSSRMNTSGTNAGGWSQCRMRNVVLGSTDTPNGNATPQTTVTPLAKSLMSCIPADLRAVMKPMTKWTDNVGGGQGSVEDNVKPFVDYITLLAENEIFGKRTYCNEVELSYTAQYAYYAAGNSRVKNGHLTLATSFWWERSPYASDGRYFCDVSTSGGADWYSANNSYGVAPAFLV